ncbi:MAG: hypothetical protein CVV64_07025 [Candidatus Wallbacteria bacterium HGW-Wallbacteria-1]|jgi:small subunit ribosomal protein S1|uniref:Small ribosomal subunit protein bS1 n=1 Tax=Candidatus Wallbacteria bacterium HGW-Wallbacteria-1 TaxID=2013854 RepID=A0A2N1PT36_9BACT|nr:MAG: hypothetical protein CVV64_07025 [Candidatus Wallbacteria bacterium HGW-Wallbacteria-1]
MYKYCNRFSGAKENRVMVESKGTTNVNGSEEAMEAEKIASKRTESEIEESQKMDMDAEMGDYSDDSDDPSIETMEALLDSMDKIEDGAIIKGTVVSINEDEVLIDVGYKSEGIIPRSELLETDNVKVDDELDVMVVKKEDRNGNLILSRRRVTEKRAWDAIFNSKAGDGTIEGKVVRKVKGGLNVDIHGVLAFVPGSQMDIKREHNYDKYIGNTYTFAVMEVNKRRNNIILSRRKLMEENRDQALEKLYGDVKEGDVVNGTVRRITEFGAFVDIGGVDGLLHITDLSWAHVKKVTDVVNVDEVIEVKVLAMDREKGKISLGLKQKSSDPWIGVQERYSVGTEVEGVVRNIVNYGAFVEIEPGLEGLVHHSDMSWTRRVNNPKDFVKSGEEVRVRVLEIDLDQKKISLGMKQLTPDPWDDIKIRYKVDDVVKGKITNVVSYGAFVELEPGLEGLVHVSDMSWTKRVKHPDEIVRAGEDVDVRILEIDVDKRKISFGIKQATADPWSIIGKSYDIGEIYTGKVTNITNFGIFVELEEGIEGLVHVSDISWTQKIVNPAGVCAIGDEVKVKVLDIKPGDKKISLGIKQVSADPWSSVETEFKVGETYTGTVKNLTNFGAFVELKDGVEGLVHISDMSWTEKIDHPSQILKSSDKIRVKVLEINTSDKKISLGLKQLVLDPWAVFEEKYHEGMIVDGEVLRITSFGAFVRIEDGIEGLVHISQLSDKHVEKVEDVVAIGDRIRVKIIEIKDDERKLRLSLRDADEEVSKTDYKQHMSSSSDDGQVTLGDIMSEEMRRKLMGSLTPSTPEKPAPKAEAKVVEEVKPVAMGAAISPEVAIAEARKMEKETDSDKEPAPEARAIEAGDEE